jgi:hypothetical protein
METRYPEVAIVPNEANLAQQAAAALLAQAVQNADAMRRSIE